MNTFLSKINNKIKQMPLYLKVRDRLFYYKGPRPLHVIVVGLPRSGTSFLTGLIVRMGFDPGPKDYLRSADKLNPYGYYENNQLMKIDHDLLKKFNGNVMNPPELPDNWVSSCKKQADEITSIIESSGIQVYKGNMLVILADLYHSLFPNVKWIFISRTPSEIVRSMSQAGGTGAENKNLYDLVNRWQVAWNKSNPSINSLNVKYEDFFTSPDLVINSIAKYLNVNLSDKKFAECLEFFQPNKTE